MNAVCAVIDGDLLRKAKDNSFAGAVGSYQREERHVWCEKTPIDTSRKSDVARDARYIHDPVPSPVGIRFLLKELAVRRLAAEIRPTEVDSTGNLANLEIDGKRHGYRVWDARHSNVHVDSRRAEHGNIPSLHD